MIFISWLEGCMLLFNQEFAKISCMIYYTMLKWATLSSSDSQQNVLLLASLYLWSVFPVTVNTMP
jgi:hypothetical protein